MNTIKKTDTGDDIYFHGHVAKSIKRGDVILRPIIPINLLDSVINWIMPGNFEHGMLYIGNGKLLNPYPDKKEYVHEEDIFSNFEWYKLISKNPRLLTFARITDDECVIEKTILGLQNRNNKIIKREYCTQVLIDSFIKAGISETRFEAKKIKGSVLSIFFVDVFKTGYEISLAAKKLINFEKI